MFYQIVFQDDMKEDRLVILEMCSLTDIIVGCPLLILSIMLIMNLVLLCFRRCCFGFGGRTESGASSAIKTYNSHLGAYLDFCNKMQLPPVPA